MNTVINFIFYSVINGTPLLFGTTGEIITQKSGNMNLGVEGMMAIGAIGGYYFATKTDSLLVGILVSFAFAAVAALLYSFLTVTMQANQNVTGLALTIFGLGIYRYIGRSLRISKSFPVIDNTPHLKSMVSNNGIPFLRDIPYIGKLLFSYNWLVYLALVIAVAAWFYIQKTHPGLRMRATGENPAAADACGVNVKLTRYVHTIIGGGICGIGGLYLGMVTNGCAWNENWIGGMGWVSVALVIFANWNPAKAILGSMVFGMFFALNAWNGILAAEFPSVLGWLPDIPVSVYLLMPYAVTAIVLIISSVRKKRTGIQPNGCGVNYFREDR